MQKSDLDAQPYKFVSSVTLANGEVKSARGGNICGNYVINTEFFHHAGLVLLLREIKMLYLPLYCNQDFQNWI